MEVAGTDGSGPSFTLPSHWLWWEDGAHDGATNMATDEALRALARPDVAVWRWYSWARPTVSFGRHERVLGRFSTERLAASGLDAVRRPTGGRALLHARELTYSVTLALPTNLPWTAAYDAINRVLLDALLAMGVPVTRASGAAAVPPDGPVCFDQPANGELVVHGQKLVGSAVWRRGDAYLQHGSILLHDDQALLADAETQPPPPAAALATLFPGRRDSDLQRDALDATAAVLQRFATVAPFVVPPDWPSRLASHHRHFADPEWLWRR